MAETVKIMGGELPIWDKETSSLGNVYLSK